MRLIQVALLLAVSIALSVLVYEVHIARVELAPLNRIPTLGMCPGDEASQQYADCIERKARQNIRIWREAHDVDVRETQLRADAAKQAARRN